MSRKFAQDKSEFDSRGARYSDRPPAMLPNLPILRLEPGRADQNDLAIKNFLDGIYTHCLRDFGELAEVFTTGSYPNIKFPKIKQKELTDRKDPSGMKREIAKQQLKIYFDRKTKLDNDKPKMYAVILGQMSNSTLERIQRAP